MATGSEAVTVGQLAHAMGITALEPLPAGYTRLEYIEGDGGQYIDTDISATEGFTFDADFMVTGTPSARIAGIIGAHQESYPYLRSYIAFNSQKYEIAAGDSYGKFGTVAVNSRMTFHACNRDQMISASVNGAPQVIQWEAQGDTGYSPKTLHLFMVNGGVQWFEPARMRVYSCKIYTDGPMLRNMVPARRDSDGAVGMYDTVAGAFFANSGTGAFKAGPEVPISDTSGTGGCAVTVKQFSVASSKLGSRLEQPPAGLKETVIYEGIEGGRLYFQRQLTAIRKVVVEYRLQTNLSQLYTFTYEGEPTGFHTSSNGRVRITFSVVGESPALVVGDATGASLIRFERVIIYEQQ